MDGRIGVSKGTLNSKGVLVVAIDEVEQEVLGQLLILHFPEYEKNCVTIIHNPSGQQGDNFSYTHEFAYFVYPKPGRFIGFHNREDDEDVRNFRDVTGDESLRNAAANCFYPIYIKGEKLIGFGEVCEESFHPSGVNEIMDNGVIAVYPIDPQGIERKWRYARNTVENIKDELIVFKIRGRNIYDIKRKKNIFNYKSVWTDSKYSANNHGTQILNSILGAQIFSYPKSINLVTDCIDAAFYGQENPIVLDFFAGSGTTAHAVINLNREDEGNRKYILVEMGEYFDTVMKPRIQKVIYSKDWKDGKPVSREGSSHLFKYIRLESYEDALNNLELKRTQEQSLLLAQSQPFRESYMLSYMLDVESKGSPSLLNIEQFEDLFNYKLKISIGSAGEAKPVNVDLVETFNYLIGLTVQHIDHIREFRIVQGTNPKGEKVLIIWRNLKEKSNEDLEEFFRRQEYNPRDMEFDLIYVNGDNNLENIKRPDETWKVRLIEEDFMRLMFDVEDI